MTQRRIYNISGRKILYASPGHSCRVWFTALMLSFVALALSYGNHNVHALSTRTIWLQVMDSCQQAIPGATFKLAGNGLNRVQGPAPGAGPQTVNSANGACPLQRGNCAKFSTGCLTWSVPIPAQGTATYQISEISSARNYVPCTGGSVCSGGPLTGTLTINSSGNVAATIHNVYPDKTSVTWPASGSPYSATQTDPITVHNFGLGTGSCDGDNDADDHLTGSPGSHCDSDGDRK